MKKILIAVTLVIIGGGSLLAYQYFSNPRVISVTSESVTQCSDSDGKSYFEYGQTDFKRPGQDGSSGMGDYCDPYFKKGEYSRKAFLREGYCQADKMITEMVDCGFGNVCRVGVCMKGEKTLPLCVDSDGGDSPKVRGSINAGANGTDQCFISNSESDPGNNGSLTDRCVGKGCYVYEYFCDNSSDHPAYKLIPSSEGCENGAAN